MQQLDLAASARGLLRHYRIGAAARGYDGAAVVARSEAFDGIGLRPYPVCHLRASKSGQTVRGQGWVRRTRIEGDNWQQTEVPLGEEAEAYLLRIMQGAAIRAEYHQTAASFLYPSAAQAADGVAGPFDIAVAQLSARFGPGPFRRVSVGA